MRVFQIRKIVFSLLTEHSSGKEVHRGSHAPPHKRQGSPTLKEVGKTAGKTFDIIEGGAFWKN